MEIGNQTEKPAKKFKLNQLQTYIIVFFVIAVALILISWFFQTRLHTNSKLYEDIIAEQKTTLTSNTSLMKDLQAKYLQMEQDYNKMKSETDAREQYVKTLEDQLTASQAQISEYQIKQDAENDLSYVQTLTDSGKTKSAKNILSRIDRTKLSSRSKELYDSLKKQLY